jgi:hypothetical protein
LIVAIAVAFAACAAFALVNVHQANVAIRNAQLARLLQTEAATHAAGKALTGDVADYSSAYGDEAAGAAKRGDAREQTSSIDRARAANERVANDLQVIVRAYSTLYGDAATQSLRAKAASAHDACARSLDAWARAAGSTRPADAKPNYLVSEREDRECGQYGFSVGNELGILGSRLDADLSSTRTSLSVL